MPPSKVHKLYGRETGQARYREARVGCKRAEQNAQHVAAVAAWEREHGGTGGGSDFARDVLPSLASVPLRVMAEATGLSEGYCSFVRRGTMRCPSGCTDLHTDRYNCGACRSPCLFSQVCNDRVCS